MILAETAPIWERFGEQTIWFAAVATALGVLSRTRPARWVWRHLVTSPVTEWGERVVGSVVEEKVSKPNGGSSVTDKLANLGESQEILARGAVANWKRQDDILSRVGTIHQCLDRRFSETDARIDKLTELAELVLQEATGAKERIRQLYRAIDVPIYETDADGWRLYVNPAWTRLTGLSIEEASGEGWAQSLHPEDRDRVFEAWRIAVEAGKNFTVIYRVRNSHTGVVTNVRGSASPIHDGRDQIVGWIGTLDPIPESSTLVHTSPDALSVEES